MVLITTLFFSVAFLEAFVAVTGLVATGRFSLRDAITILANESQIDAEAPADTVTRTAPRRIHHWPFNFEPEPDYQTWAH